MDLDLLRRIARAITEQFGGNSEVVVHDLRGGDAEHTVVVIENGHVSSRKVGDGPSRVVLEALKNRSGRPADQLGYLTRTQDGRILKSSTVFLYDGAGEVEGVLSINYDVTELIMAERAIDSLLHHKQEQKAPERIPQNVNELLDDLIEQSVALVGKPVAMMTKDDKIAAIQFLNNAGRSWSPRAATRSPGILASASTRCIPISTRKRIPERAGREGPGAAAREKARKGRV